MTAYVETGAVAGQGTVEAADLVVTPAEKVISSSVIAARAALAKEGEKGKDAESELIAAVEEAFRKVPELRAVFFARGYDPVGELDGMHVRDFDAVQALGLLGEKGSPLRTVAEEFAARWKGQATEKWADYSGKQLVLTDPETGEKVIQPTQEWDAWAGLYHARGNPETGELEEETEGWQRRFARVVARILWRGEVKARVDDARAKQARDSKNPPALALVVVNDVERVWHAQGRQLSLLEHADGRTAVLRVNGEEVATTAVLSAGAMENVQSGMLLFRSYMGHLAIRGFAERGWEKTRTDSANPSFLGWEGGLAACAEDLGARSKKAADELRDILLAGQSFHRAWAGGEIGGLWTYTNDPAKGHRPSYLEVRLGRPLMPYMVKALGPRERTLVPVVKMPPRVGARANEWAAQAAFQFALVRAMVEHRVEVAREGGARLTAEELARMARAVGLPEGMVARVLDRWTQDGSDGLACLEVVERDRYVLPDNPDYREARAFIEAGGKRTIQRKRAGEASVRGGVVKRRRKTQ